MSGTTSMATRSDKQALVDAHECFIFDCDGW
jgi:hypothetical protein